MHAGPDFDHFTPDGTPGACPPTTTGPLARSAVRVWQDGRSGGWLTVDGLPRDLDDWTPDLLTRWGAFAADVESTRQDFPRRVAEVYVLGVFEPHVLAAEEAERAAEAARQAQVDMLDKWTELAR